MVRVGQSSLIVFTFLDDERAVYDRFDTVSLLLIERLEHIDAPSAA